MVDQSSNNSSGIGVIGASHGTGSPDVHVHYFKVDVDLIHDHGGAVRGMVDLSVRPAGDRIDRDPGTQTKRTGMIRLKMDTHACMADARSAAEIRHAVTAHGVPEPAGTPDLEYQQCTEVSAGVIIQDPLDVVGEPYIQDVSKPHDQVMVVPCKVICRAGRAAIRRH
jgi:hypothetical protein